MTLFVAFEILGTIAFAVSGAVVAISKKMDIFGVAILGMTTAVGGGILRDLILGITPPAAFQSPGYALTSIAVSMLVFLPPVRRLLHWNEKLYDTALLLFDAIGLGIFTVIGVQTAYIATGELNAFLAIFVGVVTGCGGGVMRDVFAGSPPYIFVKHFLSIPLTCMQYFCFFTRITPLFFSFFTKKPGQIPPSEMLFRLILLLPSYDMPKIVFHFTVTDI